MNGRSARSHGRKRDYPWREMRFSATFDNPLEITMRAAGTPFAQEPMSVQMEEAGLE